MPSLDPNSSPLGGLGLCLRAPESDDDLGSVLSRARAVLGYARLRGCTTLWVTEPDRSRATGAVPYEAYSLLGALATEPTELRLGVSGDSSRRRAPSIMAKIVTGIDVISHGRALLTLDADGADDADPARLAEALEVARAVLEDTHPAFDGRIYSVADAVNRPAPMQADGVPLVVYLHGEGTVPELLEVCARSADAVVVDGGHGAVEGALAYLEGWHGRRIRRSGRVAVLGRIDVARGGDGSPADAVAGIRALGADGCLVGIPAPWSADLVEDLGLTW